MMHPRLPATLLPLALLTACGDAGGDSASAASTTLTTATTPATSSGEPTTAASEAASAATTAVPTSSASESDTAAGPKLDIAADTTTAAPGDGCPSVDILFVIDNSGSMADQQQSLVASFPGFITAVQTQLGGAKSYHIGVTTTDIYPDNAPNCIEIGDLITQTGGPSASGMNCQPFTSGTRYLDETEPDLGAKFACMGLVGTGGSSDERPMRGLLNALKPATNAPTGCNALFSRPEALLVVVIITDEDDVKDGCDNDDVCMAYGSGGDKNTWYDELLSYRNGVAENIVVLALIGRKLDNPCAATPASKLLGFTNLFDDRGFIGDVCAEDYAPFFADALPVIDQACQHWVPPA